MSSSTSRIASTSYSATHSTAALQSNYATALPEAAPPPQATLPHLPLNARSSQPNTLNSAAAATYSTTGYAPSSPDSAHPDSLSRRRGESSPAGSRHRASDWNGQGDSTAMEQSGSGQGRQSRRQSSSTTPRRLVDGREETREERRARKERERALRGEGAEDSASPTTSTRRRSSRSNGLPNSPSGGDDLSNLSLGSPPLASATSRTAPSTSSKSVLTIALQRAQSAVLLDSANNVPAAISAYTQSVRLLKEVMQRVEEGARREREKERLRGGDRNVVREGESHEEFQRRVAKAERKERAKQDEARRLRVIHDTYEDRIRMLQTVGDPSTDELSPPADTMQESSSPSTPSTIHAHSPSAPSSTFVAAPELTRRSRSITSLGTVSTPPASFSPLGGPPPTLVLQHPTPGRPGEFLGESAADIGNAMLIGSPPASPMDPKMPSLRPSTSSSSSTPSYGPAPQRLAPSMARRPSIADEVIDEEGDETTMPPFDSRASISSDSTATSMSRAMTLNGPADPSVPFRHPSSYLPSSAPSSRSYDTPAIAIERGVAAIDLTSSAADEDEEEAHRGSHLPRSESYASSESDDIVPVTAMEYGVGWPSERMDSDGEADQTEREELSSRASSFGASGGVSPASMRRSESGQSSEAQSMRRGQSGDSTSMQRTASGDSVSALSMRGSSLFGPGGFTQMSNLPPPPLNPTQDQHSSSSPRYSTPLVGIGHPSTSSSASRPRPGRSASLANAPTFAVSGVPSKRAGAGSPLISPSTHLGTISQRRRSPAPNGLAREPEYFDDEGEGEQRVDQEGHTVQGVPMPGEGGGGQGGGRPLSAERSVANEFGLAPQAAGGFSSASLPTRFRTQSSPRPPLLSSQSEVPNGSPTMLGATSRSFSSSGGGYPRKGSIPGTSSGLSMPSTLPPLGRSNSSSSQGSFSETRDHDSRGSSPYTQSPNLSHSQFSLHQGSTASDTPTYSTFPRGSTSFPGALTSPPPPPTTSATATAAAASISTIRRPFHLLRQILESLDGQGAYITPRLFVPPQVWSQAGVKLVALETKVRMLDLLLSGLDSLSKVAVGWSEGRYSVKAWREELESFEGLMEGIQSTLSKKLGYGTGGKKMGSTSFSAWSSKLSRSLDRVANGRSLDKPDVYSEILAKVLRGANVIDLHLDLLASNSGLYSSLSSSDRARIEQRLKRASDFFGHVICRFVMRDVGMLVDKYVKRAGAWLGEG